MPFQKLIISQDGHRILQADGTPFFYLADTAWELFHRLTREETYDYLKLRAQTGFTAIQAVALAEFNGIASPNAYGRLPLLRNAINEWDIDLPDTGDGYGYWDHVDYIVQTAAELGLYIAFLPAWGDKFNRAWGKGPELLNAGNAYRYGKWLGSRYDGQPNIIWILGGDRSLDNRRHFDVICRMAAGIREADDQHLISFHPTGGRHSSECLHEEPWLDFNMIQSGHTRSRFNYEMIAADYALTPAKPVLDGEPGYEDHPENFDPKNGYLDAADTRQFAYMAVLSGACGHTYGNHSVWGMIKSLPVEGFQPAHFCLTWNKALYSPGAVQMRYVKDLMLSRDFISGKPNPELVEGQLGGVLHIPVLKGKDYLFAYTAQGGAIRLKPGFMEGRPLTGWWYDPRNGEARSIGAVADNTTVIIQPPSGGRGNDWILVIDSEDAHYGAPGHICKKNISQSAITGC